MIERKRLAAITASAAALAAFVLSACGSHMTDGEAVASPDLTAQTTAVAESLPSVTPISSQQPAPRPDEVRDLLQQGLDSSHEFWAAVGHPEVSPALVEAGRDKTACAMIETRDAAWACKNGEIAFDRSLIQDSIDRTANDDLAAQILMAHETGHHAIWRLRPDKDDDLAENRADCLAGVQMRWVVSQGLPDTVLADGLSETFANFFDLTPDQVEKAKSEFAEGYRAGDINHCWALR